MKVRSAIFVSLFVDYIKSIWHQSSSAFASVEDASTSGTFVYRGQHDDLDLPRTLKSRLGIQEKTSIASHEDSGINLSKVMCSSKLISFVLLWWLF